MSVQDSYKHLNDDGDGVVVGIEAIAEQIVKLNYGTHRLLSAIARLRLARRHDDPLALRIKALLDAGAF